MQVIEPLSKISTKLLNRVFWKLFVLLNHLEQVTSSAILEDNPKMISCFIPVVELEDMAILEIMENSNLKIRIRKNSRSMVKP